MKQFKLQSIAWIFICFLALSFTSCDEDEVVETIAPVASFQTAVSETNYLEVTFSNFSQNATSYSWDFGNGDTSTEESPVYTYAEDNTYTVVLTATNDAAESVTFSLDVLIEDPLSLQRALIGESGKEWQLLADGSTGVNTFVVGPTARNEVWWGFGAFGNEFSELCERECIMDDTWTFNTDGTFTFDNHDDFYGDGAIFAADYETCFDASVPASWIGADGQDLSGWASGTHGFVYDPSASTLTTSGGFIGKATVGTDKEYTSPQSSVVYSVVKLVDAEVDTLTLGTILTDDSGSEFGYWEMTLVSYATSGDAIVIEECEDNGGGDDRTSISDVSVNFESEDTAFGGFGSATPSVVDNPVSGGINTSTRVGQVDETDGAEGWSGISTKLTGLIDFTSKQTFKVKVYSPTVGAVVKFKLEDSMDAGNNKEIDVATTVANEWEELTFEFSTDDSDKWDVLVLFFDFLGENKVGARVHYFDDVILE